MLMVLGRPQAAGTRLKDHDFLMGCFNNTLTFCY